MVEVYLLIYTLRLKSLLLRQFILYFMLVENLVVADIKYPVDYMVLVLQLLMHYLNG